MFIGKRSRQDISSDDETDNDKTPTNEPASDNDSTPKESLNDLSDMKHTLENAKRAARGEHVDKEDLENIKEEYSSYFDEESGNTTEKEALKEIIEYLEVEISTLNKGSLAGLQEALDEIPIKSSSEPLNKKVKGNETSSTENSSESSSQSSANTDNKTSSTKPSDGLSPLDHVLDKQSTDPMDFGTDLE